MKKTGQSVVWVLIIGVVIVAIVIFIIIAVNQNNVNPQNGTGNTNGEDTNFTETGDGTKVNTSEDVAEDKQVGGVLIEQSKIVYANGTSKLTSKVTNDATDKDNLRFKVTFIANDGSVMAEAVGFVGNIKASETKYIDSYITIDTSNSKSIKYEIME